MPRELSGRDIAVLQFKKGFHGRVEQSGEFESQKHGGIVLSALNGNNSLPAYANPASHFFLRQLAV